MEIEVEVQKRKIILYDLTVRECNSIIEALNMLNIKKSFTILDQNDKCVSMRCIK